MSLFDPASRLGRGAGALLALAVATGCAAHYAKYPRSPSTAFQEYHATTLGRLFEPAAAEHPGESGVLYMRYGSKALVARLALADLAERSLDLQYFIWDADISGHLLADRIIRAADRGVRVRVLLDDLSIVDRDTAIAQLSAHPNIEIRAFNPFRGRGNRWTDFLTDPSRVNRRSHNKLMIADNAIAIVGGRNIADTTSACTASRTTGTSTPWPWARWFATPRRSSTISGTARSPSPTRPSSTRRRPARTPTPQSRRCARRWRASGSRTPSTKRWTPSRPRCRTSATPSSGRRCVSSTTPPRRPRTRRATTSSACSMRWSPMPRRRS